ncbi:hypothetical protein XENTR_v10000828 [Xenopus tropicalis]|nr:hypothetical protein XENTR_v10000828 [Xenopus tropicalis]
MNSQPSHCGTDCYCDILYLRYARARYALRSPCVSSCYHKCYLPLTALSLNGVDFSQKLSECYRHFCIITLSIN